MSEPAAVEPTVAADAGGRMPPAGFGYALAQGRLRVGLSIEQAAARIRLHPKQLQAIENEDLQLLPAAAYVNGFVRNYAREIGIDPGPLIEDLNAKLKLRGLAGPEPDLGAGGPVHAPMLDDRGWRHLILAAIVIALICAGLIGLRMVGSTDRHAEGATPAPAAASSPTAAAGAAAPAEAGRPEAMPSTTSSAAAVAPQPGPDTDGTTQGAAAPVIASGADSSGASAPAAPAGAGAGPRSAEASASASPPVPTGEAEAKAASPASGRTAAATMPPPAGATTGLLLRFIDRSWVQVSQPDGHVLLSHIGEAGSIELINASAPMVLVVGRGDAVKVEYRGRAVNLKPYVNATSGVARVLLAEGDAGSAGASGR